jgi:hypothetical protein
MRPLEIWYVIPSANPSRAAQCLEAWKNLGYKTACILDEGMSKVQCDKLTTIKPYPGYFTTVNNAAKSLLATTQADIIVTGGDDMFPHAALTAQVIGEQFFERFPEGFGVMQPVGDKAIPGVENICGSPWMGRDFCERSYGGNGPFWHDYYAYFGDQELKEVAEQWSVLWQRDDLTQIHLHWARPGGPQKQPYQHHNETYWERDKAIHAQRAAQQFPGSECA